MLRETEHNLHGPNQSDLVLKMSMARNKDAAANSLEPPSRLSYQELQDESTDESSGYLPQLSSVKFFLSLANKDQPS